MAKKEKTFAVIGLGKFGFHVAQTLAESGAEVIACDKDEEKVKNIGEIVTSAYVMDATDEKALVEAGINTADVVIISIGSNIEASLLVVIQLINLGVKEIIAKAVNPLHGAILERLGVKRVVYAEKEMGIKIAKNLLMGVLEEMSFAEDYKIFEIETPKLFIGKNLQKLDLRRRYDLTVLAIKRGTEVIVNPSPTEIFKQGDILLILGKEANLKKIFK
jgi:trk system potassium uptake protein TrkA